MTVEDYQSFASRLQTSGGEGGEEEGEEEFAILPRLVSVTQRQRHRGEPPDVTESFRPSAGYDQDKPFSNYAIVHRKCLKVKGDHEKTDVEIQCRTTQAALREIIGKHSYPDIMADPIVFSEPCYPLFQFKDEITEYAESPSRPLATRERLAPLMEFMKTKGMKDLQEVQEQQVAKGVISFKHVQLLYRTGDVIVGQTRKTTQCWLVQYTSSKKKSQEKEKDESSDECSDGTEKQDKKADQRVEIQALSWAYDGKNIGSRVETLKLHPFSGLRAIRKLKYVPLKYMPNEEKQALVNNLISRGRKWCELVGVTSWNYEGIAQIVKQRDFSYKIDVVSTYTTGEIILDHNMFVDVYPHFQIELEENWQDGENDFGTQEKGAIDLAKSGPTSSCSRQFVLGKPRKLIDPKEKFVADELQALLSPGFIPGYSLEGKFWGYFGIADGNLKPIEWEEDPTRDLRIDPKHRDYMSDLINQQISEEQTVKDVVLGKGSGLIILLYGSPGCGKTLTAELFAKKVKRPLVSVSASDLGEHPYQWESKLQIIFRAAQSWKAILLIDEADTILGKRLSTADYLRRCLTSLFLRRLEYFQGIMFLTTNRFIDFDDAFASRVQLILHYPSLRPDDRAKIWEKHMREAPIPPEWNLAEKCLELGKRYELNGRDIRNLVHMLVKICRQRNQPLSEEIIGEIFELRYGRRSDIKRFFNSRES